MNTAELTDRAGLYGLLRSLYTYPLGAELLHRLLEVEPDTTTTLGDRLSDLQASLADRPLDADLVEDLNVEMTRLLEGPGLTPAPPYASFYLHSGQLMGPMAVDARMSYLAWEIIPDTTGRVPDDHIGLELGFLAHLAQVAADTEDHSRREAALDDSKRFIEEQLSTWLGSFLKDLRDAAREPFFRQLASFTAAAVAADRRRLDDALVAPSRATSEVSTSHRGLEG